eukprot:m.105152 g.105152  ORF g.105152 m.105152 type:complete len:80 (-) comp12635_c0_seq1:2377-2616(-)
MVSNSDARVLFTSLCRARRALPIKTSLTITASNAEPHRLALVSTIWAKREPTLEESVEYEGVHLKGLIFEFSWTSIQNP